jgi:hypothetical protein
VNNTPTRTATRDTQQPRKERSFHVLLVRSQDYALVVQLFPFLFPERCWPSLFFVMNCCCWTFFLFLVGMCPAIYRANVQLPTSPRRAPGRDEPLFTEKVLVINGSSAYSFRGAYWLPQPTVHANVSRSPVTSSESSCLIRAGISKWRNPIETPGSS